MSTTQNIYDLIIIGGGPAGVSAGVYAARKRLKTLFLTKDFSGQSAVSERIENWIGSPGISGLSLSENLKNHVYAYKSDSFDIVEGNYVDSVKKVKNGQAEFSVKSGDKEYLCRTILVASGSSRRKLEVPGADKFEHKGLTYCASCDGPLFADMDTVVIGGGNAAFETAAQLLAYAKSVTLLHRSDNYKADEVTVEKVLSNPKMKAFKNVDIKEIKGDAFVNNIVYTHKATGETVEMPVSGIFVEIGSIPNTGFLKGVIKLDEYNRVKVDPKNQKTETNGIWAAGDCTDGLFHQNNIAAGDAVKALEDLYLYLHAK